MKESYVNAFQHCISLLETMGLGLKEEDIHLLHFTSLYFPEVKVYATSSSKLDEAKRLMNYKSQTSKVQFLNHLADCPVLEKLMRLAVQLMVDERLEDYKRIICELL